MSTRMIELSEEARARILSAAHAAEVEANAEQKVADEAHALFKASTEEACAKMMVAMELRNLVAMSKR